MTTKAPEDAALDQAETLGKFIAANVVPERQNKLEDAVIAMIYQARDAERERLSKIYEGTQ